MAAPSAPDAPRPADLDTGTLSLLAGFAAADLVQAALAREGFGDLRFSHGYVFQQLVAADPTVGDLAAALGMTQQGASKAVAELEGLGYTERVPDPRDARVRRVRLTPRGRAAVEAARRARADLEDRLARRWGAGRLAEVRELLAGLLEETGGADAVRRRQVLPPR
ncbi:MarR family winged helix-turn-helix transcriptional regulator [Streptacidiphilus sp. ASG 303]|uniref:MarR family winged helix-turn-helix transcriptional regulator n=1 Tax=Streptacidiphilus sp. ASG 303 TaxID=2896847 RepID=UPI001E346487|nr:MarR family winged helix-turn-helix transcriptional regulator [Streptacidiphilus sp. ASG 303]MCD0483682.1 MarR family winged helix-turn-helix transcriptional regulator [Streptacidiphilus sp. ASG 303]